MRRPCFFTETVHRLKVAGKQVLKRPSLLWDAIKKCSLKALWLPDTKRILIDKDLPLIKQRWAEGHEVIHSVIPWHDKFMFGDTKETLSPGCHEQLEAEANFGAGRLLFLQSHFDEHLNSGEFNFAHFKEIAARFENSITTTMWRAIEHQDIPAVAMITDHPHRPKNEFNPLQPCRYLIRSRRFESEFSNLDERTLFMRMKRYCRDARGGTLGEDELILADDSGEEHIFSFETFYNQYDALTIGRYLCPRPISVGF